MRLSCFHNFRLAMHRARVSSAAGLIAVAAVAAACGGKSSSDDDPKPVDEAREDPTDGDADAVGLAPDSVFSIAIEASKDGNNFCGSGADIFSSHRID
jgi:hypothetical protein